MHIELENEHKNLLARLGVCVAAGVAAILLTGPEWLKISLFIISYLLAGGDVLLRACRNIARGRVFDENFLMAIATLGALAINEMPEAIAVMLFYQIGEMFQDVAVEHSRRSISALMGLKPDRATMEGVSGELNEVAPEDVPVGSIIVVRPGELIPLDGTIESGTSSLDTSRLTGESMPRDIGPGDMVLSGSVNISGLIRVRTTGAYAESTVARILDLVENAETGKARTEKFITRFAAAYTPAVVVLGVLMALGGPLIAGGEWLMWLRRALIFLVISCPCALVVSIPLSFFAGIGAASRERILIKGSNYLEALARLDTVVFDKTGTLTRGSFEVVMTKAPEGIDEAELLNIAATAERFSTHPLAAALRKAAGRNDDGLIADPEVENFAGEGVRALINGRIVWAGNDRLMARAGVRPEEWTEAGTVVHVARDGRYMGFIVVADRIKDDSREAIRRLEAEGVRHVVMLTGDRQAAAEEVASSLGISEVGSELLPADKVARVEALIKKEPAGRSLAFVGDGINDAPVLKLADVGIAMGAGGSDAAIEAADVVLMDDDVMNVPRSVRIARRTMSIVRENIWLAIGIKAAMLVLGALGVANMWEAVFADVGVTMLAVLNALRAMRKTS